MLVLHDAASVALAQRLALGAFTAAAIALAGYRARWLDASGTIAAVIIGALAFGFGGMLIAAAILIFFITGSALSHVHNPLADLGRNRAAKSARRDWAQVVANGGVASACVIIGAIAASRSWPSEQRWMIAAVSAVAAVSGDTWSTEIGAFSRGSVRMITTMLRVPPGTSGGITPVGTIAAPLGGAVVGLAGILRTDVFGLGTWLAIGALAGLIGSAFDSMLGATVQGMWRCSECGQPIESPVHEACGCPATLVRGVRWLDNDAVNGLTSLCGAALGYALAGLRG